MTKATRIPQLFNKDDSFSRLCSELLQDMRDIDACYEDLRAYGAPSECGILIGKSGDKAIAATLQKYGYTQRGFLAELGRRTTGKFVYNMGPLFDTPQNYDVETPEPGTIYAIRTMDGNWHQAHLDNGSWYSGFPGMWIAPDRAVERICEITHQPYTPEEHDPWPNKDRGGNPIGAR